ncbi:MAG: gamma-glutamylcyclotransferase [Geminicoccaceae bacterium]
MPLRDPDPNWVFAYGSLLWRPGFACEEVLDARLHGYHRSLCVYSWVHRGTREVPGIVLGLDRGGSCRGRVFRIAPRNVEEILAYLDERELVTAVYRRKRLLVGTPRGRLPAWCYVVRREHEQYAGRLEARRLLELIRQGCGISGRCREYLSSTVAHLEAMGIVDGPLHALARQVEDG